jgi:hypothetical protein
LKDSSNFPTFQLSLRTALKPFIDVCFRAHPTDIHPVHKGDNS